MLFNRFAADARLVVEDAVEVAREFGASNVEAEHLLLAAARGDAPVARVLREAGLDFDGLAGALRDETARSLAAVGVNAEPVAFSPPVERPRFATSAKAALERALRAAVARRDRRIGSGHVVLGALEPARGTVARALECAGVDRLALSDSVAAVL
jgi:ATP-dependent Clp protease ATP-binding subunit ClpA